jgi:hydrogenase expression/formation protein HypC
MMCLGVPGRVVRWIDHDPLFARAEVEFGGLRRECCLACVPDVKVGDYVIVHAGVAITRIDAAQARRIESDLSQFAAVDQHADDALPAEGSEEAAE